MASLSSAGNHLYTKITSPKIRQFPERSTPTSLVIVSCHGRGGIDGSSNEIRRTKEQLRVKEENERKGSFSGFEKFGESLMENLSPKQKGDWKDLTLMSLSFAVYVYISQQMVCAYFIWMSMPRQQW